MIPSYMKPVVLAILDGWGYSNKHTGNPIQMAKKPVFSILDAEYPNLLLQASGLAVGMNYGEVGNSEVGHLNIGAGRIVQQYQSRIQQAIKDGSFFNNIAIKTAFSHAKENNGKIHIAGLLTSGTVHADFNHVLALLEFAKKSDFSNVSLHLFTDGRDSGLQEGAELLKKIDNNSIATIVGRTFAMDRDKHFDMTKIAFEAITMGKGERVADFAEKLRSCYANNIFDPNIPPLVAESYQGIAEGDAVFFFNFREDSMRQLYSSFINPPLNNVYISSMTDYLQKRKLSVAFYPPNVKNNLAEVISGLGIRQLHIAESDKYAHATFFFNGLREDPFPLEDDEFVPSLDDIEAHPEMSAGQIADRIARELQQGTYGLIVANFANADLLAHTGNYNATLKGIEAVDTAIGKVIEQVLAVDAIALISADHGNAETLVYSSTGERESRHNDSPAPIYLIGREYRKKDLTAPRRAEIIGVLADIAPTILELMGIPQPDDMTGKSLLGELR